MAENESKDKKKIIVDENWKQRAQKEKEVLTAKEEAEKEKTDQEERHGPLPKGDFAALLNMLFTQTLFSLGVVQMQGDDKREPDLALAKYNIDMLESLEEKTKGNLSDIEQKTIAAALNDLRMVYVKVTNMIQKQE